MLHISGWEIKLFLPRSERGETRKDEKEISLLASALLVPHGYNLHFLALCEHNHTHSFSLYHHQIVLNVLLVRPVAQFPFFLSLSSPHAAENYQVQWSYFQKCHKSEWLFYGGDEGAGRRKKTCSTSGRRGPVAERGTCRRFVKRFFE